MTGIARVVAMAWEREIWFFSGVLGSILAMALLWLLDVLWWTPVRIERCLRAQGIRGTPYKLVRGNTFDVARMAQEAKDSPMDFSNDIVPRVLPFIAQWSREYGKTFFFWFGPKAQLVVTEPQMVKEILVSKHEDYPKRAGNRIVRLLAGYGLLSVAGKKWSRQRKLANRAFHAQNIKGMVDEMLTSSMIMVEKWKLFLSPNRRQKMEVCEEFRVLTSDMIARTAFGSNYLEGKRIFELQVQKSIIISQVMLTLRHRIPGYGFIPTRENMKLKALDEEIHMCIRKMIESRVEMEKLEKKQERKDLLGLLLEANNEEEEESKISLQTVVDECKGFFVAGQETSTYLLTWSLVLLAAHKDWQEKARKEIEEVLQGDPPNSDTLARLKIVSMILFETLRLYSPAVFVGRKAIKDGYIGKIFVKKGVELVIPLLAIHHDQDLWGDDVDVFNPERFVDGLANAAKHPMAFMGFSMGPRICVGQNFALTEAKVALTVILQHFAINVCPEYVHAPTLRLSLHPQHGAHVIVEAL